MKDIHWVYCVFLRVSTVPSTYEHFVADVDGERATLRPSHWRSPLREPSSMMSDRILPQSYASSVCGEDHAEHLYLGCLAYWTV